MDDVAVKYTSWILWGRYSNSFTANDYSSWKQNEESIFDPCQYKKSDSVRMIIVIRVISYPAIVETSSTLSWSLTREAGYSLGTKISYEMFHIFEIMTYDRNEHCAILLYDYIVKYRVAHSASGSEHLFVSNRLQNIYCEFIHTIPTVSTPTWDSPQIEHSCFIWSFL